MPSTLTVTSATDDSSAGTLRTKIGIAQNGDTIRFANSLAHQTINLTQGEIFVPVSVTIQGWGPTNSPSAATTSTGCSSPAQVPTSPSPG